MLLDLLSREPDLVAAWVFGSHARGQAGPGSDLDLLVLFEPGAAPDRALRLAADLSGHMADQVDVVDIERTSIELAARALCEGRLVFERAPGPRVDAEVRVLSRAHDLAPTLRRQRAQILQEHDHDRSVERYRAALGALGRLR